MDEQKQIVNILGKCETIIKSRKRELKLLDDLIKARLNKIWRGIVYED